MDSPVSKDLKFRVRLRTRWSDEDNQGLLNNAVYLTLFEEARHAYFSRLELMRERRFPFVLAQTNLRFLKPGRGGSDIVVEMSTTRLGGRSFEQFYRVSPLEGSEPWCEGEAVLVAWDDVLQCSQPLPPEFRRRIEAFEGDEPRPPGAS